MKILRCPKCGSYPVTEISTPNGVDAAGFTTVTKFVSCNKCGNTLEGDPRNGEFLNSLAAWKVNLEDMPDS